MNFTAKKNYSPAGNAWNLLSANAFDGAADPGFPGKNDDEEVTPPIEGSLDGDNQQEATASGNADLDSDDSLTAAVDPARTRAAVDPARTRAAVDPARTRAAVDPART